MCLWCGNSKKLQPKTGGTTSACQGSCDAGYVLTNADFQYECGPCVSSRCKPQVRKFIIICFVFPKEFVEKVDKNSFLGTTCSTTGYCTACASANQRFISKTEQSKMPAGVTIQGERDCIATSDIIDWFYYDATEFKPCLTDCKRCSSATTCDECGDHSDLSRKFFLDQTPTPHTCTQTSCLLSNYQYKVGGGTCLQCTSTTYWIQNSSPPVCGACDTNNRKYVDESDRICKECASHCADCNSSGCLRCLDPNEYLQTDSTSCGSTCGPRQMKVEGPPKKCQPCPPNCAECNERDSCTVCDKRFYLSSGSCTQCPTGCGTCTSSTECLTCSDPTHFLGTDKQTCSRGCNSNEYADSTDKKCKKCEFGSQRVGGICTSMRI